MVLKKYQEELTCFLDIYFQTNVILTYHYKENNDRVPTGRY